MVSIDPNDFPYPISLLRKVMNLSSNAVVIPNGYEHSFSETHRKVIRKTYDFNALIISGRPDFQIFDNDKFFLAEGKTSPRIAEAVPVLLNQLYSKKTGIPIYYSYLDSYKLAEEIPFNWIKIPKNHEDEFKTIWEPLFKENGVEDDSVFEYTGKWEYGSGDPFILDIKYERLDKEYIIEFLSQYKDLPQKTGLDGFL